MVRLTGTPSGNTVTLEGVIGGATTSDDLVGFAFDLLLEDDQAVQYVDGSAAAGSALNPDGMHQVEVLVEQTGDRITIGVARFGAGAGAGIGVPSGESTILSLVLRVRERKNVRVAIVGSPPNVPAALDSAGQIVTSVWFDTAAALISGT